MNLGDGFGKALSRDAGINRADKASREVPMIMEIDFLAAFGPLPYLKKLPLCRALIEMRHPLADNLAVPVWEKELQSLNVAPPGMMLTQVVHPQSAESKSCVDGGLRLGIVHSQDRER